MILGMSIATFTLVHVVISLVAIASGLVVFWGMFSSNRLAAWTALFLAATVLTTATGCLFPITGFTPALGVGLLSSLLLAIALVALYGRRLSRHWRAIYVITALAALYLTVFVGVVQSFQKLPFLQQFAPTQSELPFVIAQTGVLLAFVAFGALAVFKFHPERVAA
ncbi:MAG: hypothetical protein IRZ09_11765 [Variibacter sp.]|mgnify:CR=1 FL=1|nr:hypothetical protein [Variibacter sp.]